jgi:bacteriocin biosynthesis cyclodehydratase domain-containing protein
VLVESLVADAGAAEPLVRADVAHLSVVVREGDVVIGPLVRPGAGPCLRCLDLHRADRDPQWPGVLAQLLTDPGPQPQESALARLAAALAALQVLAQLDGLHEPAATAATLEVGLPHGLVSRRPWPAHAGCGCHWPPPPSRAVSPAPGTVTGT